MKIKLEVEIDTKEDMQEIEEVIELITEFKESLVDMQNDYDD